MNPSSKPVLIALLLLIVLAVSFMLIQQLSPRVNPLEGIRFTTDRSTIEQRAAHLATLQGIDPAHCRFVITLQCDRNLLARAQSEYGAAEASRLARAGLPVYYWVVQLLQDAKETTVVNVGGSDRAEIMKKGVMSMSFDLSGRLLGLEMQSVDSSVATPLTPEAAYERAVAFLLEHGPVNAVVRDTVLRERPTVNSVKEFEAIVGRLRFTGENIDKLPASISYNFTWSTVSQTLTDSVDVTMRISGNAIASYSFAFRSTQTGDTAQQSLPVEILALLVNIGIAVLLVIMGIRKIRAYEIGWKKATVFGLAVGALFAANVLLVLEDALGWQLLLSFVAVFAVIGGGFMLVWAVSEAVGREAWMEKYYSLDLITHGHVLHSRVGSALMIGPTAGVAMFALWSAVVALAGTSLSLIQTPVGESIQMLSGAFDPLALMVAQVVPGRAFALAAVVCLLPALVGRRFRGALLPSLIAGIAWAAVVKSGVQPFALGFLIDMVTGMGFALLFRATDVVTAFLAMIFFALMPYAPALTATGDAMLSVDAWVLMLLPAAMLVFGCIAKCTSDAVADQNSIAPSFAAHISERMRLQRELEVAREVQMSFLPKSDPRIPGLDIASCCIPALEVGGDYYDFIELGQDHLVIAIGDVSGKGTQAAFYMTLAKGFLRALVKDLTSPAEVLTGMNALFCENVEPGHFITMMVAVIDVREHRMTVARAGHNPLLIVPAEGAVQAIQSPGLAMGMERGNSFGAIIQDVVLPFKQGDVFVFYTDGFSETMTRSREEFGEERLKDVIVRHATQPSSAIAQAMVDATRAFAGRAQQHDDMTAVVVKVEGGGLKSMASIS